MKLLPVFFSLFLLTTAPALAAENHSGFGAFFTHDAPAGFQDPAGSAPTVAQKDDAADAVKDIEPAAGDEAKPAAETPKADEDGAAAAPTPKGGDTDTNTDTETDTETDI